MRVSQYTEDPRSEEGPGYFLERLWTLFIEVPRTEEGLGYSLEQSGMNESPWHGLISLKPEFKTRI